MQEKLKIFSASGEIALETDLAGVERPLMLLAGDKPELVDAVPAGAEVLGALVRDEDGWTLASARADAPVMSGPRTGSEFHLSAGVPCALGPWVFRIEREGVASGTVLLWRVGSSAVAADNIVPGRNIVAEAKDGSYSVNPPVGGLEICSIFPGAEGVDVASPGGGTERLSVPFATLFGVGSFQGMALPAEDAAKALASGSPFSWPSRRTRSGLMAMLLVSGLAALVALAVTKKRQSVDAQVLARHGPELVERSAAAGGSIGADEDALVFENSFYRSLPLVLKVERSAITQDLIRRGKQIAGHLEGARAQDEERTVSRIVAFLQAVDAIQEAVRKGDWNALKDTLDKADREMFTRCDADKFYGDAREIAAFVTDVLPRFFVAAADSDAGAPEDESRRIGEHFDRLSDNMFMSGNVVRRERDNAQMRWDALSAYLKARGRFFDASDGSCGDLRDAWADFADAFESDDSTFAPMLRRQRARIADEILRRAGGADAATLVGLCALGEAVGVENSVLAQWRARAADARREISAKYRAKYSDYRMRSAVAPGAPETLAVLDEMIALGLADNQFHKWALREKERVAGKKGGAAK